MHSPLIEPFPYSVFTCKFTPYLRPAQHPTHLYLRPAHLYLRPAHLYQRPTHPYLRPPHLYLHSTRLYLHSAHPYLRSTHPYLHSALPINYVLLIYVCLRSAHPGPCSAHARYPSVLRCIAYRTLPPCSQFFHSKYSLLSKSNLYERIRFVPLKG
ncbi:hypothetical protein D3C76_317700 [compost metagenome]